MKTSQDETDEMKTINIYNNTIQIVHLNNKPKKSLKNLPDQDKHIYNT